VNTVVPDGGLSRAAELIGDMRRRGVRLWTENGQLRYRASKAVLSKEDFRTLAASRKHILALLETAAAHIAEPVAPAGCAFGHAPLTFSQLAHLHFFELETKHSARRVTAAIRLLGALNVEALRESLGEVINRHDVLRVRISFDGGVPAQVLSPDCVVPDLNVDDLTSLAPDERVEAVRQQIGQLIREPLNVSADPLWTIRLLQLDAQEHALVVAMEHLISDATSVNLLVRDLFTAYQHIVSGRDIRWSTHPMRYFDYAHWQRTIVEPVLIERNRRLWQDQFAGVGRLQFPLGANASPGDLNWSRVPVRVETALKAQLSDWARSRHSTLVMVVFGAYVAQVLRWCGSADAVIQYQANARESERIRETLGYFASILPLRIKLHERDTFSDLLEQVTQAYCEAHERADYSYLATQRPPPPFTANPTFNWQPRGALITGLADAAAEGESLRYSRFEFDFPLETLQGIDLEPFILLADAEEGIAGELYFPLSRSSVDEMEQFVQEFIERLRDIVRTR
jgi:hypothetical protein